MPWRVHDQTVRIDPRVRHLVPHDSERPLFEFVTAQVRPGTHVLDVGAFLGIYAVIESRLAGAAGKVTALEPTAWSASMARRHIHYNAARGAPITLIEAAAGEAPGTAMLHEYDEPYVNALASAVDVTGAPRLRAVSVVTLDDVCASEQLTPTFIRMDVQGAEWHVLRGARETIRQSWTGPGDRCGNAPAMLVGIRRGCAVRTRHHCHARTGRRTARAGCRAFRARRSCGVHAGAKLMTCS